MFLRLTSRGLHFCSALRQVPAEKSKLASLRKATGYTIANCKKALEINNNDVDMAEKWLQQQAQALGWLKVTKLEGRKTKQGLVAALAEKHSGNLVEVNCETDFVARNENFINFIGEVSKSCQAYINKHNSNLSNESLMKVNLSFEELCKLNSSNGKRLEDELALLIGNVGENATLRRALCFKSSPDIHVIAHAHPLNNCGPVLYGKYAVIVALKANPDQSNSTEINTVGRNICQHIIGMNPMKIGSVESDTPNENVDNEECLVFQELLSDPSKLVYEYLQECGITVLDFKRFECGEENN